MVALIMVMWLQIPQAVQQATVEIPLKHAKAGEVDTWLANGVPFTSKFTWTVNHGHNSLVVTGSAKEIKDFRSTLEYQDKKPVPLEFEIRRVHLSAEIKSKLDFSPMREWMGPGNSGIVTHYSEFALTRPGELFDLIKAIPASDNKTISTSDSGHIRYCAIGDGPDTLVSVFCRVNGDNSVSTRFVLDSRQDLGHGPQLVRYRGNRRMYKGTMIIIRSYPEGPELTIVVGDGRRTEPNKKELSH